MGGIRTTEKTNFEGVRPASQSSIFIQFNNVWLERLVYGNVKKDVWVEPDGNKDMILVKVEPGLTVTTITVVPTFLGRVLPGLVSYHAKEVTIWVSNNEEKVVWEEWARKSKETYLAYQEQTITPSPPRKITPPTSW